MSVLMCVNGRSLCVNECMYGGKGEEPMYK